MAAPAHALREMYRPAWNFSGFPYGRDEARPFHFRSPLHPVQTWAFFFGLIIASSAYMIYDIKGWKVNDVLFFVVGIVLGVVICTLSPTTTPDSLWFIFICGAIAVCTMILPGISGSFILVILGKYDFIMQSVNELNIPVLVVFGVSHAV